MYANHAAREDTIVFPAWKKNFSNAQLDEISDQFEDIEHKMFGKDGIRRRGEEDRQNREHPWIRRLGAFCLASLRRRISWLDWE
jgi:hypothetical protein